MLHRKGENLSLLLGHPQHQCKSDLTSVINRTDLGLKPSMGSTIYQELNNVGFYFNTRGPVRKIAWNPDPPRRWGPSLHAVRPNNASPGDRSFGHSFLRYGIIAIGFL